MRWFVVMLLLLLPSPCLATGCDSMLSGFSSREATASDRLSLGLTTAVLVGALAESAFRRPAVAKPFVLAGLFVAEGLGADFLVERGCGLDPGADPRLALTAGLLWLAASLPELIRAARGRQPAPGRGRVLVVASCTLLAGVFGALIGERGGFIGLDLLDYLLILLVWAVGLLATAIRLAIRLVLRL